MIATLIRYFVKAANNFFGRDCKIALKSYSNFLSKLIQGHLNTLKSLILAPFRWRP